LGIVSCQEIPSNSAIYTVTDVDNNLILTINNHQELKVQLCGVLTQITATLRHRSGQVAQGGLVSIACLIILTSSVALALSY
jgi:hypothetical protein